MGIYFVRLLKAFIISTVAVYAFINGPSLYANVSYLLRGDAVQETPVSVDTSSDIVPVLLPLADINRTAVLSTPHDAEPTRETSTPIPEPTPVSNRATLNMPKIGISVPIVFGVPAQNDKIYSNLTNGVVHYSATPKPGEGGASVILGHSSLYPWQVNKYGAPFALLGKLRPGDKISVTYDDGQTYTYTMKQSIVFNPLESENDQRLAEFERSVKPLLILVTCWPVNSTTSRIAIQAELD